MAKKHPFEKVFSELANLLQFVEDNKGKDIADKDLPKDIDKWIDTVEGNVEVLRKLSELSLKEASVSPEETASNLANPSQLPARQRRLLEKARKLREQVEAKEREYSMALTQDKLQKKVVGKGKSKKKAIQARKKKFKKMGGHKKWKPI